MRVCDEAIMQEIRVICVIEYTSVRETLQPNQTGRAETLALKLPGNRIARNLARRVSRDVQELWKYSMNTAAGAGGRKEGRFVGIS